MATHIMDYGYHYAWDKDLTPQLEIDTGDRVIFECREAADGQITPSSTYQDLENGDIGRVHAIQGPIFLKDAEVGDVVEVELTTFEHHGWGWTALQPKSDGVLGKGLLEDEYSDLKELRILNIGDDDCLDFLPDVRIPINPSCGLVGLAPEEAGPHRTLLPRRTGGNMDNRYLRAGSKVFLPVEVAGGLLSLGDCHLSQGDGQSSLYAVEAPMTVTARIRLHKDWHIAAPHYITAPGCRHRNDSMAFYSTSAFGPDLYKNAQDANRSMVEWLMRLHDLKLPDAYLLTGLVGNLVINEIVDTPHYHVSMQLPRDIFR